MPFEFETGFYGWDQDNAYFLVKACETAYTNPNEMAETAASVLELKEDTVKTFSVADSEDEDRIYHGFAGSTEEFSILVFRGTENMDHWLTDANIVQKAAQGGMVHKGFANTLDQIWDEVESLASEQQSEGGLWLAGHGLGGALAVLAASRLKANEVNVRAVYNFGAPRVGNLDFFYNYGVPTYRVVYNNDIYPHVPAETVTTGGFNYFRYKHVGTLRYYDRHKQPGEGTNNWTIKKNLIHARLVQMSQPPTSFFEDHHIDNYVQLFSEPEV